MHYYIITLLLLSLNYGYSQKNFKSKETVIKSGNTVLTINSKTETKLDIIGISKPLITQYYESERLIPVTGKISNFEIQNILTYTKEDITQYTIIAKNKDGIKKIMTYLTDLRFSGLIEVNVEYINQGNKTQDIKGWSNHTYSLESNGDHPSFYAFIGSSTSARENWIQPIDSFYWKKNFMGMNNSDYGGGIPVLDVWRKDIGIAIGHLGMSPKQISFPLIKSRYSSTAEIMADFEYPETIAFKPKDTLTTIKTFIYTHTGDCFSSLRIYSSRMQSQGFHIPKSPENAYFPQWCAWGYERTFTVDEILQTLPKVKELGFKWVTIDDGYQTTEGDWMVNQQKFPGGSAQMKALVDSIHQYNLLAQLWWAPLAISPDSKLFRNHPDYTLKTKDWAPQYITWWDAYYMAPTDTGVIRVSLEDLRMFIRDWGFDGLKLDGQHMNAVPPDYGDHSIKYPEQACEELPMFFDTLYTTAESLKKNVLIQHCPCGTCMSYFNLGGTNQTVSSDPLNSLQIRQKNKVYKAISPQIAYFGDHVELSDKGDDFATTIGIGAVPGSKFTWPLPNPNVEAPGFLLTPEKEILWKHWLDIYNKYYLSKGEYLGQLYDIGYDKPEVHVIKKDDLIFYAFYADHWEGVVAFKGLDKFKSYSIWDYVNNKKLGQVTGTRPTYEAKFDRSLLVYLKREDK